jgi:hypothetical protein
MAAVKIADILIPSIWAEYVIERTKAKSRLFQSGILAQGTGLDSLLMGGGNTINMPLFKDLTGASEVLSDSTALTVNKISTAKDIAVRHMRGKAWGSNDLAAALAGVDPMDAITELVATWWMRDMQTTLFNTLTGVFAAAAMAGSVSDISITDAAAATNANKINNLTVVDAFAKLGDEGDELQAIAMHSALYWSLVKNDFITFTAVSGQGDPIRLFLGKEVIVDDSLPRTATTNGFKYTSYLFGASSIGYGELPIDEAVETDRDILAGEDYLTNRRHFLMHPMGVKWQGAAAGAAPTNAELAIGTNWDLVYEQKNVRLVKLVTNG